MIQDFVIELQGSVQQSVIDSRMLSLDRTRYDQNQKVSGVKRNLNWLARGVQDVRNEDAFNATLADFVAAKVQPGDPLGFLCIAGFSRGSIFALSFADKLNKKDLPIRYLGISDLPIFPFGLNPAPACFKDNMIPLREPDLTPSGGARFILFDPLRALSPAPLVTSPSITATRKRNFYQTAGNGAKLTNPLNNPRGISPWWWSSNMPNNEIHGEISGGNWENVLVDLPLVVMKSDADYHNDGDRIGFQKISSDINDILGFAFGKP